MSYIDEDNEEAKPKKVWTFSTNMAVCADKLYTLKAKRKKAQAVANELKEEETALTEHIIKTLPMSEATGIAGKLATISIEKKEIVVVKDWAAFYKHLLKTKAVELLNKAVNSKAVQERWNAGKTVPGTDKFTKKVVSVTKRKGK